MANKIITSLYSDINKVNRFEPRYFYNRDILQNSFNKYGFTTIDDISKLKSGSTPINYDNRRCETDAYFIKSADVKRYNINRNTISYVSKETHDKRKDKFIAKNDVLITNTGKYLGFTSIVQDDITNATTNQNIFIIRLKDSKYKITPYFLVSFLNSHFGQLEIESLLTLTGQKYLNSSNFKKMRIPTLLDNQVNNISTKVKSIYEKDVFANKLLNTAKETIYKCLYIDTYIIKKQKFFSVNLNDFVNEDLWTPKYSYPLYVDTIKELQKRCQTVKLKDIVCNITKGDEVGSDVYINYIDKRKTDVPFIRTTDLVNYEVDDYPDFFIPQEIYTELNQGLQKNDILYTKDGKIGNIGMITDKDKVIISAGISVLRINNKMKDVITPEYLFCCLSLQEIGYYQSIQRTVVASTIPHLREVRLEEFVIPIIEEDKVKYITDIVKQAFKLKEEKKLLLKEVKEEMDSYFEI